MVGLLKVAAKPYFDALRSLLLLRVKTSILKFITLLHHQRGRSVRLAHLSSGAKRLSSTAGAEDRRVSENSE
jgi:hypothetical protein